MYYRLGAQECALQAQVSTSGIDVVIDLEDPKARLSAEIDGKSVSADNVNAFLAKMPAGVDRNGMRAAIYHRTRSLFDGIEQAYPDSSLGVVTFLTGKDYRTPLSDLFYNFGFTYQKNPDNPDFKDVNSSLEMEFHMNYGRMRIWPARVRLDVKGRAGSESSTLHLDPYSMTDLFFNSAKGGEHRFEAHTLEGAVQSYDLESYPRHNITRIKTGSGLVKVSYDELQLNILSVMTDLMKDLALERDGQQQGTPASYIMHYWDHKGTQSAEVLEEERRLVARFSEEHETFDPSTLGMHYDFFIACDIVSMIEDGVLTDFISKGQKELARHHKTLLKRLAQAGMIPEKEVESPTAETERRLLMHTRAYLATSLLSCNDDL